MGFAGFVTGGLVPAVGGALKGVNERARMAEEQRRYNTQQAGIESQRKWQQQQAIEAAQRQAAMDELTRTIQMGGLKNQAERNAIDMERASHVAQPSESYQEMVGPEGPGVYGITEGQTPRRLGGIVPKPKAGTGAGDGTDGGKTLPSAVSGGLFELHSLLRVAQGAAQDFKQHPEAFGPWNRIPGVDLVPGTGSQYRLNMGDLVSLIGKARSGGAITPQEFARLERFLPNPGNLDEKNAAALPRMVQELESIIAERKRYYEQQGYAVPDMAPGSLASPGRPKPMGEGNSGPSAPPAAIRRPSGGPNGDNETPMVDDRTRAMQLKKEGYSKEDALTIMRNEGRNVE